MSDDLLIGGWFTPDYRTHADRLTQDIEALDLPYLLTPVPSFQGSWEAATRMKAEMAQALLSAANGATLLLVDVDARIHGPREAVLNLINHSADIALRMSGKISKSRGTTKMHPFSGTMAIKPTPKSWELLENWRAAGLKAPRFATDETTLGAAICATQGIMIQILPEVACADSKTLNPIIEHPKRTGKRSRMVMVRHAGDQLANHALRLIGRG